MGGAIRVRTIRVGWPQLGQRNGARGLTRAVSAVGMIFNTHCNNAISHGPRLAAGYWVASGYSLSGIIFRFVIASCLYWRCQNCNSQ